MAHRKVAVLRRSIVTSAERLVRRYCPLMSARQLYDWIGEGYAVGRRTDARIGARIEEALGDARTVVNVGAGTSSYEPRTRWVVAVEPSSVMRAQRPPGAAPVVAGAAEALPFASGSFDAAMSVLSDHHWRDPIAGFREMRRVAAKVVVLQWDATCFEQFWLIRDYLPEVTSLSALLPSLADRAGAIGATLQSVAIPGDCADGFFHAYWRRPHAYLDPAVRRATSVWARLGSDVERRAVTALAKDLANGEWERRNGHLRDLDELDLGARLLVTD